MAQVAKNIEGNQGVLAKVVSTLEAALASSRLEKDDVVEAARSDKKTWERMLRESERQLREVERQRDRAQALAAESDHARKATQDNLESSHRMDSEVLRALQAEKSAMARELKMLRAADASGAHRSTDELTSVLVGVESLRSALGLGTDAHDAGGTATALREAHQARDDAVGRLESLRVGLQAELLRAVQDKEEATAELAMTRADAAPAIRQLRLELEAACAEATRERHGAMALSAELDAARAAREKLLVQARLDGAALASREREHSQQLCAKEVQVSALERELSTIAGQLVAAQAEVRVHTTAVGAAKEQMTRERHALLAGQSAAERERGELQAYSRGIEGQRAALVEQVAQATTDRQFCYELISDLRDQLAGH